MPKPSSTLRRIGQALILLVLLVVLGFGLWWGLKLGQERDKVPEDPRPIVEVGVVLPLSGPLARYGGWIQNALELAREQHNADLSNRYRIVYVVEDDAGESQRAVTATNKLIQTNRVPVVFGTWTSSGVLAMAPVVEDNEVVLMADAISPQIREAGEWVFRCVPDARLSLAILADYLKTLNPPPMIALLYINNDFGRDLTTYLQRRLEDSEATIGLVEGYESNTQDFRTIIEKVRRSGADSLFVAGYTEQANLLVQADQQDLGVKIFASPSFENPDIIEQAQAAAENVIYPNYFDRSSDIPAMQAFLSQYFLRYGEEAEGFGASAFAGMEVLRLAMEACDDVTSACIRRGLNSIEQVNTVFGPTRVDEVGDIRYPLFLKTVRDGRFVRLNSQVSSD